VSEPKERLFRDDVGAALERAALLAEENARLRRELARLRDEEEAAGSPGRRLPVWGIAACACSLALFVTGVVLTLVATGPDIASTESVRTELLRGDESAESVSVVRRGKETLSPGRSPFRRRLFGTASASAHERGADGNFTR